MKRKLTYRLEFEYTDNTKIGDITFLYVISALRRIVSDFCERFKIKWSLEEIYDSIDDI